MCNIFRKLCDAEDKLVLDPQQPAEIGPMPKMNIVES